MIMAFTARHIRSDLPMRTAIAFLLLTISTLLGISIAQAAEPVKISREDTALDLTKTTEIYLNQGNVFQLSTAAGADGIVRRIEVRSTDDKHQGDWAVFALANVSDEQLERVIVAPHFRLVNSRLFWPDLGSQRIISITPSEGFALERVPNSEADVFSITLNPGAVVTFVAELSTPELPQLYLWEPEAYKDTVNAFTLYRGIVLGIAGLLALILTILFVVKGTAMLPAAAALAWAVLGYVSVDFGFLEKLVSISSGDERIWRAATEVGMAASLVLFLFSYLNLNRWHTNLVYATLAWMTGLLLLAGAATYDPSIASGIARLSFALTAVVGVGLILFLGLKRYDRAILLVPSWALLVAWLVAAWMTVVGRLDNDIVQPALGGGLVLIVLMIGFTVMQHAFSGGSFQNGLFSDLERQAMALTGSGDIIWDWDVARDRIVTIPDISVKLGLQPGTMHGQVRNWLPNLHPDDRDRFRATMDMMLEHRKGKLNHEFRVRAQDGHYHWLAVRARPVVGATGEVIRCVGTLIDVTEERNAVERLLHDPLNDNLTGLPNRQLFIDRTQALLQLSSDRNPITPTILAVGIDDFRQINERLGIAAGDNILIVLARRLRRLVKSQDTLARISGDRFGIVFISETETQKIADFADAVLRSIATPIDFAGQEIILSASIGLASWLDQQQDGPGLLNDAELAMLRAKREGGSRVEPFRPAFRTESGDNLQIETELRRALERKELTMVYQPIVDLSTRRIAGFEALMRWEHPRRGDISPAEFIPVAEASGLINQVGLFALERAVADYMQWQAVNGELPVFVSVNLSSAQLINAGLYDDFRSILAKTQCDPAKIKLELTESVLMENPQQSSMVLARLKDAGFSLALDDFGSGYSGISYITSLPFDTVKIDRSLVTATEKQGRTVLVSMIAMIRQLGMDVVAEGIETDAMAAKLAELGCTYGQSYLFGPPITAEMAQRILKERFPLVGKEKLDEPANASV